VIYTDWRYLRIPNAFTYPAMVVGVLFGLLERFPGDLFVGGFADHLVAIVVAFAVCYPFYAAGGLKAGDAKLLMAIGALRGLSFLLVAAIYGALLGGVIAIFVIARRRLARPAEGAPPNSMSRIMKSSMPYGVALGLGGLVALALEAAGLIKVVG
jgi:prepilin peptidase CpaA